MQNDLKAITDATTQARDAISRIKAVKSVLTVAASFIALGGAIASAHPGAIADAAKTALKAIKDAGGTEKKDA
jgi:hypothetical protein